MRQVHEVGVFVDRSIKLMISVNNGVVSEAIKSATGATVTELTAI